MGKVLALIGGGLLFTVLFPFLFGIIGKTFTGMLQMQGEYALRNAMGIPCILIGSGMLVWSVKSFWTDGGGTPAPFAAPQRLVITGPYRYCRNPIQLGAMFLYFGMGATADSLITGASMLILALVVGTLYHRTIEEKELRMRFGAEYEEYRRRTPFLVPRFRQPSRRS